MYYWKLYITEMALEGSVLLIQVVENTQIFQSNNTGSTSTCLMSTKGFQRDMMILSTRGQQPRCAPPALTDAEQHAARADGDTKVCAATCTLRVNQAAGGARCKLNKTRSSIQLKSTDSVKKQIQASYF